MARPPLVRLRRWDDFEINSFKRKAHATVFHDAASEDRTLAFPRAAIVLADLVEIGLLNLQHRILRLVGLVFRWPFMNYHLTSVK